MGHVEFIGSVFERYNDPMDLLTGMITMGRFRDFVRSTVDRDNDKTLWEFYLNKVDDKSFADFKKSVMPKSSRSDQVAPSEHHIENIIKKSRANVIKFAPIGGE